MQKVSEAIKNWSQGLLSTDDLFQIAKSEGYRLEREENCIHAVKFGASFSRRIG